MTAFSFNFDESSQYGQDVLQLIATVAELMNEEKSYNKTEVKKKLSEVRKQAQKVSNAFTYLDPEQYVKGVQ